MGQPVLDLNLEGHNPERLKPEWTQPRRDITQRRQLYGQGLFKDFAKPRVQAIVFLELYLLLSNLSTHSKYSDILNLSRFIVFIHSLRMILSILTL